MIADWAPRRELRLISSEKRRWVFASILFSGDSAWTLSVHKLPLSMWIVNIANGCEQEAEKQRRSTSVKKRQRKGFGGGSTGLEQAKEEMQHSRWIEPSREVKGTQSILLTGEQVIGMWEERLEGLLFILLFSLLQDLSLAPQPQRWISLKLALHTSFIPRCLSQAGLTILLFICRKHPREAKRNEKHQTYSYPRLSLEEFCKWMSHCKQW